MRRVKIRIMNKMYIDPTNFNLKFLIREPNFEACFVLRMLRRGGEKAELIKPIVPRCSHGLFINVTVKCIGEPILLEQYVVLKNYQKQYHNDISLTKGYTVGVIEKHESGKYTIELVRHLKRSSRDSVY